MEMKDIVTNPAITGPIALVITWIAKKLDKTLNDVSIVALTGSIAILLAIFQQAWLVQASQAELAVITTEGKEFVQSLCPVLGRVAGDAGAIFISAHVIYYAIKSKFAERAAYRTLKVMHLDGFAVNKGAFLQLAKEDYSKQLLREVGQRQLEDIETFKNKKAKYKAEIDKLIKERTDAKERFERLTRFARDEAEADKYAERGKRLSWEETGWRR